MLAWSGLCQALFQKGTDMVEYKMYKIHKACYDKAPKCDFCHDILVGEYVVTKGDIGSGTKLHRECIEPYKKGSRPQCGLCNEQIMEETWTCASGKQFHSKCKAQP